MRDVMAVLRRGETALFRVAFALSSSRHMSATSVRARQTDNMARRLMAHGDAPHVLAPDDGLHQTASRARQTLNAGALHCVTHPGYPVFRAPDPARAVRQFAERTAPDVAVLHGKATPQIAQAFQDLGIPVVVLLGNSETERELDAISKIRRVRFIATARHTADACHARLGQRAQVISPLIEPTRMRIATTGAAVVVLDPVPGAGLNKALKIAAACPDIPFVFQQTAALPARDLATLRAAVAPQPNIQFAPTPQEDRAIYAHARLILAPQAKGDHWAVVAAEAHINGIPLVGTDGCVLPEAIGPGGALLPINANVTAWVIALRAIWDDPARYDALRQAALAHGSRPELKPERHFAAFRSVLQRAIADS